MTEKKANEIIRTKYPDATIFRRNSFGGTNTTHLAVVFEPCGKVYDYYGLSYQQVLIKLGFKILYKHNVDSYNRHIAELEKKIADKGEKNEFHLFDKRDWIPFSEEEIKQMETEVERMKAEMADAIITT